MAIKFSQLDANQVLQASFDDDLETFKSVDASSLIPCEFDEVDLSYTGDDLTQVVYKKDSVTVATLTLSYSSGNLTNIVRS